ncbi:MAG: hypothetical protein ACE5H1_08230 [Thermodesulfobacteriota bacterium]
MSKCIFKITLALILRIFGGIKDIRVCFENDVDKKTTFQIITYYRRKKDNLE